MQTGRSLRRMHQNLARSLGCAACSDLSVFASGWQTFDVPMEYKCLHLQAGSAGNPLQSAPQASTAGCTERSGRGKGAAPHRPPASGWLSGTSAAEAGNRSQKEPYWLTTPNLRRLGSRFGARCSSA